MSTSHIPKEWRRLVAQRADGLCEYCLIHEEDTFFGCEVDHVISEKHGGGTELDNLAYACVLCNRAKGSDIGSVVSPSEPGGFHRFYNPRRDAWSEHLALDEFDGITVIGLTPIGIVTVRVLKLNAEGRLQEREALRRVGRFPSGAAQRRLRQTDI